MIIDSFIFFNELDLLEGRLEYLYDTVDYFLIVETDCTFSGNSKPLNYLQNIKRYQKYTDKILYLPFHTDKKDYNNFENISTTSNHNSPAWKLERFQRNYLTQGLNFFPDDALVIVSDLDEIPNKLAIQTAKEIIKSPLDVIVLQQTLFYFNFSRYSIEPWCGSIISTNKGIKNYTPQNLRDNRNGIHRIQNGGWHISYWGGAEKVSEKIKSYSHTELNNEYYTNIEVIKQKMKADVDPFNSSIKTIATDFSNLPSDFVNIFKKYSRDE